MTKKEFNRDIDIKCVKAMDKWIPLSDLEQKVAWSRVELRLRFRPSVDATEWPSILEPKPFKTFSVAHYWDAADRDALTIDLESKALRMFQRCAELNERMYALDWHHECMWFYPHRFNLGEHLCIPVFPDGDYYIFLSESLEWGWFGHSWEQSICVFGTRLLKALDEYLPALFSRVLRAEGEE